MAKEDEETIVHQAELGDVTAQVYLGWAYSSFGKFDRDETKAEYWLKQAASTGDINARRALARLLYNQRRPETVNEASKLSDSADFYGDYLLGHLFINGDCGVVANHEKGLYHLRLAAERGHLISRVDLVRLSPTRGAFDAISQLRMRLILSWRVFRMVLRNPDHPSVYR